MNAEDLRIKPGKHWPQFVEDEIERKKGLGHSSKDRLLTDGVTYVAIILSTYMALRLLTAHQATDLFFGARYAFIQSIFYLFFAIALVFLLLLAFAVVRYSLKKRRCSN
ncbi:hypothetical protein ACFLVX_04875 [Chloroflexota bacterium]